MIQNIDSYLKNIKYEVAKIEFVRGLYPDAKLETNLHIETKISANNKPIYNKVYGLVFSSKTINKDYNSILFNDNGIELLLKVSKDIMFDYNGEKEIISIVAQPKICKLLSIDWNYETKKRQIVLSRAFTNLKRNKYSEEIISESRNKVVEFINNHKDVQFNADKLEKKLKNLLLFI